MDLPITNILCKVIGDHLGQMLTPEVAAKMIGQTLSRCYPGPVDFSAIAPRTVGSYTLRCAYARDALPLLRPLHKEHWEETETHRNEVAEFNPDYERGYDLEMQGRYFLIVVVENATGALVGNYGLYLSHSMHTKALIATEDTLFVSKAHRRGRLGLALIGYAEDALRTLGVEELAVSVKLVNSVGPMIERLGYQPVGTQYTKLLKEVSHVQI